MPITLDPGIDIPAIVQASPAGTIFHLEPETYRVGNIIPKDGQVFIGQDGAIVSGGAVLLREVGVK